MKATKCRTNAKVRVRACVRMCIYVCDCSIINIHVARVEKDRSWNATDMRRILYTYIIFQIIVFSFNEGRKLNKIKIFNLHKYMV